MIRTLTLALAALLALGAAAAADQARPRLKSEATVTGNLVRIGDLVENAGIVAKVAIFRAPDLGSTGAVSAEAVIEAVRKHALVGLDAGDVSEVIVTRASRTIPAASRRGYHRAGAVGAIPDGSEQRRHGQLRPRDAGDPGRAQRQGRSARLAYYL